MSDGMKNNGVSAKMQNVERTKFNIEYEFAQTTTLHGPSRFLDQTKPRWLRFMWTLAFCACFGTCMWQIWLRFDTYLRYDSTTKMSIFYEERLAFPAVTICNFNRYQKSKVAQYLANLNSNDTFLDEDYQLEGQSWVSVIDDLDDLPDNYDALNLTDFTLKTGFQLNNDTMRECTWRGKRCTAENFTHVFTSYGNCYTFNSGRDPTVPILIEDQPGAGSGLHILIDIRQDEYSETLLGNAEAGLKVLAHPQIEPPLMEALGSALPPGFHAFMGISKKEYTNLEPEWGKCDKSKTLVYHYNYTLSGCVIECKLLKFREHCQCKPVGYPGPDEECSIQSSTICLNDVLDKMKSGVLDPCKCPIPCHHVSFDSRHSYAAYPNQAVAVDILQKYNVSKEYLENNFVSLDVFYEELNYELAEEQEAMTYDALISDIGGQAGLFIGASFITFGEFIEYFFKRLKYMLCKSRRARRASENTNDIMNHTPASVSVPL